MTVTFRLPLGEDGWTRTIEMPTVPRIGDAVHFGRGGEGDEYRIHHVVWYPEDPDVGDAYVVLR